MKHSCLFIVYSSRTYGTKFVPLFCQYSLNDWRAILVSLGMEKLLPPFFPGISIIFFGITWGDRSDLRVNSTRKNLLLINLRDPTMWCIGSDSPRLKKGVSFSFPPVMYGFAYSFLQRSLNWSSISFNANPVCFENVSFSIFCR